MIGKSAKVGARMVSVSGVIIRKDGTREELGVMAFHHKNPLKVLAWRLGRAKLWLKNRLRAMRSGK